MFALTRLKPNSPTQKLLSQPKNHHQPKRSVSNSPYGRAHVWKRRLPALPNPIVPKFPQTVIRSDGSSFVQWTTSPKSLLRLTRDTTNNPVWNSASWSGDRALEEESGSTGRLGRFSRRFGAGTASHADDVESEGGEKIEGVSMGDALDDVKWFEQMAELTGVEEIASQKEKEKEKEAKKGKKGKK